MAVVLACWSCTGEDPLPEPGAEGPIRIYLWQDEEPRASRMTAERVIPEDAGMERYRLFGIALIRPVDDGLMVLDAQQGSLHLDGGERVIIQPPVLVSGLLGGAPVIGRCDSVSVDAGNGDVVLRDPILFWRTQRATSASLRLREHARYQAEDWLGRPGSAGMAAVLGALPHY
ncbi:MAG: hypothetical protein ACOCXJ_00905 [Planctomycetota bacterium]